MASPFPFTSGQVLTAAQLNSIGEATAFTPSWTNFTPGNATESWYFTQVNDLVIVQGITALGSTSSISGQIRIDYPVGSAVVHGFMSAGHICFRDTGTANVLGIVQLDNTEAIFKFYQVAGTDIDVGNVSATAPFTWSTNDQIRASFIYQLS